MARAGTVYVDVKADTTGFLRDVRKAGQEADRSLGLLSSTKAKVGLAAIGVAGAAAAFGLYKAGSAAVGASMDFDKAMSGVGAVANATAKDMGSLRDAALEAGKATVFSASEAAQAEAELAKAGVSVSDILGGALRGSLDLAAAGQLDLGNAAEISAQAMNLFNLEGSEVGHIADVLASGANKSAADVDQLGQALRQGGLVASQLGIGLEDSVGVLSLFADNALIGSDAGTSFKTMLQRLVPQSEEQSKAMAELGLSFFDAQGQFVGVEEAAGRMQKAFGGLTQEQRSAAMTTIFGADAVRAANVLYEAGASGVAEYTAAVNDQGAAQRMAAVQMDNLSGDVEQFRGSTETALIRLGGLTTKTFREVTQGATDGVNSFLEFADSPAFGRIQQHVDLLGSEAAGVFGGMTEGFKGWLDSIDESDVDSFFIGLRENLGPLVTIAENVGSGLMSVAQGAQEAAAILGPVFAEGLKELGVPLSEVSEEAGGLAENILPELAQFIAGPLALGFDLVGPLVQLVADALQLLADNTEIVLPVLAGLAAVKLAGPLKDWAKGLQLIGDSSAGLGKAFGNVKAGAELAVEGGLSKVTRFLGGPWGLALGAAGVGVGLLTTELIGNSSASKKAKAEAEAYGAAVEQAGNDAEGAAMKIADFLKNKSGDERDDTIADLRTALVELGLTAEDVGTALAGGAGFDKFSERITQQVKDTTAAAEGFSDYADLVATREAEIEAGLGVSPEVSGAFSAVETQSGLVEDALGRQATAWGDMKEAQEIDAALKLGLKDATDQLIDSLREQLAVVDLLSGRAKSLDEALNDQADAQERWNELTKESVPSMTGMDKASRDARDALKDLTQANIDTALAQLEVDGNTVAATQKLNDQRNSLDLLLAAGKITTAQHKSLVDQLKLTPEAVTTQVELADQEKTQAEIKAIDEALRGIDDEKFVAGIEVEKKAGQLELAMEQIRAYVAAHPATATINVRTNQQELGRVTAGLGNMNPPRPGGYDGDTATKYPAADGMFYDPGIYPTSGQGYVQAFEKLAGPWEAFIPGAPAKRDKAIDIWGQTGQRLGVLPMADGGLINGHTAEEWKNLERALPKRTAGHTDDEWKNLADAIKAQGELQAEQLGNIWEAQFDKADFGGQVRMLQDRIGALTPWTDEWAQFSSQLADLVLGRQSEAQDLAKEIAENQFEAAVKTAEAAGDFDRVIALLRADQAQYQAWTDGWVRREEEINRLRLQQTEAQLKAVEDHNNKALGRGTASTEPSKPTQYIENVYVQTEEPKRFYDETLWRLTPAGRV